MQTFKISDLATGDSFNCGKMVGNYVGAERRGGWGDGMNYKVMWFNKTDRTEVTEKSYSKEEVCTAVRYDHWKYSPVPRPEKKCNLCGL